LIQKIIISKEVRDLALLTPIKSIRAKCLDCSGGSRKEVAECSIVDCPLHAYRFGKRPAKSQAKGIERRSKDE